ncbi:hypothetical protein [Streptomyces sp. NPDC050548]|uniref:hypothetical protein n=1 Tax=Streptomyces sp. NPDC050548 TaxID=3365629 RepID=UPI0037BD892D
MLIDLMLASPDQVPRNASARLLVPIAPLVAMLGVHRDVAGHRSDVRGVLDTRAGRGKMTVPGVKATAPIQRKLARHGVKAGKRCLDKNAFTINFARSSARPRRPVAAC